MVRGFLFRLCILGVGGGKKTVECPYDFDSCGSHCPNWILANPKNKCRLQENPSSAETKIEEEK